MPVSEQWTNKCILLLNVGLNQEPNDYFEKLRFTLSENTVKFKVSGHTFNFKKADSNVLCSYDEAAYFTFNKSPRCTMNSCLFPSYFITCNCVGSAWSFHVGPPTLEASTLRLK